jgi:hypothetical protein
MSNPYKQPVGATRGKPTVTKKVTGAGRDPKPNPKDAKELFLKRIQICSMTYDYSDENKDARAKVERINAL